MGKEDHQKLEVRRQCKRGGNVRDRVSERSTQRRELTGLERVGVNGVAQVEGRGSMDQLEGRKNLVRIKREKKGEPKREGCESKPLQQIQCTSADVSAQFRFTCGGEHGRGRKP